MTATQGTQGDRWFLDRLWFWLPVLPLVALDLASKELVFGFLDATYPGKPYAQHEIFGGWVRFSLTQWWNTGTIWGLGQGFNLPLIVLRIGAVAALVYFALRCRPSQRLTLLVLGAILAGALGNLYDNLTQGRLAAYPVPGGEVGGVRDFLYFCFGGGPSPWCFPAFNVADSCISVGAITLALLILRAKPETGGNAAS